MLPLFDLMGKSLTIRGMLYKDFLADPERREAFKRIVIDGLASGALKPLVAKTFPFEQITEASRYLDPNQQLGKVVVTVSK